MSRFHKFTSAKTADEIEGDNDGVTVRVSNSEAMRIDVGDGCQVTAADGDIFIGTVADVVDNEVQIDLM